MLWSVAKRLKKIFFNGKKPHPIIGDSLYYSVYICICFKFFSVIFSKTTENHFNDIRKQIISLDFESEGKERRVCVHGVECVDIVSWGKLFTSLEPSNPKPKAQIHFLYFHPLGWWWLRKRILNPLKHEHPDAHMHWSHAFSYNKHLPQACI